jgi:hypothetical protein
VREREREKWREREKERKKESEIDRERGKEREKEREREKEIWRPLPFASCQPSRVAALGSGFLPPAFVPLYQRRRRPK